MKILAIVLALLVIFLLNFLYVKNKQKSNLAYRQTQNYLAQSFATMGYSFSQAGYSTTELSNEVWKIMNP